MTATSTNLDLSIVRTQDDSSRRLWSALSKPRSREKAIQGTDILGEFTLGSLRRARARRLDWSRANNILAQGLRLAEVSGAEFTSTLAVARDAAILHRDARGTVDAVFALALAAIRRELSLTLHLEQILGALAMADGCCAELATGEGKTITAILPAALEAFSGRGVHVITVNDYLARRDAEITGPAYKHLGLTVGVLQEGTTPMERRRAYDASITYLADKQAIFDHLKDRLVSPIWPRTAGLILDDLVSGGPALGNPSLRGGSSSPSAPHGSNQRTTGALASSSAACTPPSSTRPTASLSTTPSLRPSSAAPKPPTPATPPTSPSRHRSRVP
jgi:hypothetical protein